jgi:hypothetical protein
MLPGPGLLRLWHPIDWLMHGLSWQNQPASQHPLPGANVPVGARAIRTLVSRQAV